MIELKFTNGEDYEKIINQEMLLSRELNKITKPEEELISIIGHMKKQGIFNSSITKLLKQLYNITRRITELKYHDQNIIKEFNKLQQVEKQLLNYFEYEKKIFKEFNNITKEFNNDRTALERVAKHTLNIQLIKEKLKGNIISEKEKEQTFELLKKNLQVKNKTTSFIGLIHQLDMKNIFEKINLYFNSFHQEIIEFISKTKVSSERLTNKIYNKDEVEILKVRCRAIINRRSMLEKEINTVFQIAQLAKKNIKNLEKKEKELDKELKSYILLLKYQSKTLNKWKIA